MLCCSSPEGAWAISNVTHWQPAEDVAEQFQKGRVFLVGDAAHTMPPYKGLGLTTAVQSAQNLAWKLAAVIRGQAGPELLSTYQVERYPVGRFVASQSLTGPGAAVLPEGVKSGLRPEEDLPLFYPMVGYRYRSEAVIAEDASSSEQEIALLEREDLTGQPGTRVPHLWLERAGQRLSTLDLLDGRFVLLIGPAGAPWQTAAAEVAGSLGVKLAAYRLGADGDLLDMENGWQAKMGCRLRARCWYGLMALWPGAARNSRSTLSQRLNRCWLASCAVLASSKKVFPQVIYLATRAKETERRLSDDLRSTRRLRASHLTDA